MTPAARSRPNLRVASAPLPAITARPSPAAPLPRCLRLCRPPPPPRLRSSAEPQPVAQRQLPKGHGGGGAPAEEEATAQLGQVGLVGPPGAAPQQQACLRPSCWAVCAASSSPPPCLPPHAPCAQGAAQAGSGGRGAAAGAHRLAERAAVAVAEKQVGGGVDRLVVVCGISTCGWGSKGPEVSQCLPHRGQQLRIASACASGACLCA